ncbi:MAG: hypothetical protein JSS89_01525 [Bacteroidetes bacterium]|nr:hypothetical protein [Bacteroidota bacterium]
MHQIAVITSLCVMAMAINVQAQEQEFMPRWTLYGGAGTNFAASESMKGSPSQVIMDASDDYIVRTYPFGDPTLALGFDLRLQRSVTERLSWFVGASADLWRSEGATFGFTTKGSLNRYGGEVGGQIVIVPITSWLNVVGDVAAQVNVYSGELSVTYPIGTFITTVNPAVRIGARAQAGLTARIPSSPLSISMLGGYQNGNLIGKSFTKPAVQPNADLNEVELNDGKNPEDPSDSPRVISAWTWRVMIGIDL